MAAVWAAGPLPMMTTFAAVSGVSAIVCSRSSRRRARRSRYCSDWPGRRQRRSGKGVSPELLRRRLAALRGDLRLGHVVAVAALPAAELRRERRRLAAARDADRDDDADQEDADRHPLREREARVARVAVVEAEEVEVEAHRRVERAGEDAEERHRQLRPLEREPEDQDVDRDQIEQLVEAEVVEAHR